MGCSDNSITEELCTVCKSGYLVAEHYYYTGGAPGHYCNNCFKYKQEEKPEVPGDVLDERFLGYDLDDFWGMQFED